MTQPNTVDMTFDTSLVDLKPNTSFSTTESDPSDFGNPTSTAKTPTMLPQSLFEDHSQETPKPSQTIPRDFASPPTQSSTPVQHIGTQEAYDQWATIYDSDGNMLQAIDDIELTTSLPDFLRQVQESTDTPVISLLDLGCGTGRNTIKLLGFALPPGRQSTVSGLDFSKGMLDIAADKLRTFNDGLDNPRARLAQCDCFPTVQDPSASPLPSVPGLSPVNGVISTLVLEHVPLTDYFSTLSSLLLPNGLALVTNMHDDMGTKSQAGFVNAQGVKVRGSSFAHTVQDTVAAARKAGLEVLSVKEREMTRQDVESGAVGERGWKWVGIKVWYAVVVRKIE
ncbi:S-adenosyl-L-methionine-dependent methyltransferase [Ophiobolus disseminans]|uniref:S-adenosyl-L-methionine-dependent methyltransferase n=1 Tax=Ophiobolus disseminans TaxID=1469910 RepID=A0A6A6ZXN5_9PLEO|nr:S-adenosyl-L-methionine-dependent methyltransferase [Ophiobolus disseminans]